MDRRNFLSGAVATGAGAAALGGVNLFGMAQEALAAYPGRSLSSLRGKVIVKTVNSGFWQVVLSGAKKAVADFGIQGLGFTGGPSEADIAAELSLIEDAVAQKPDFLVIAPTSKTGLNSGIDKAYSAGIKVILIDSAATTKNYHAFLQTNNHGGGVLIADALAAAIKAKTGSASGQIAYATFLSNVGSLGERDGGFLAGIAKYPGLKIVKHVDAGGDQTTKPVSIAADTLTAYPNLVGYFADNLYTAEGALTAFTEKKVNMKKVSLVGWDASPKLGAALTAGTLDGLLLQNPYMMGYAGVLYGMLASLGVVIPNYLDTGSAVATPANVNNPAIHALLLSNEGKPGMKLGL
ncbi:MAG TPA: substrate-binding domain-containing protein [Chloroflexota bacterium]|nr:substrate-binding domain-containing protein [Chloroflexota bacterium]